ncbi:MAG TPA: MBL fold metallo-hydrolase [Candidatus Methylacidiphilales bacterium]|nr:MBL fold metallo-hydrolase [Candidatus Methylacidiphilales bacterium]
MSANLIHEVIPVGLLQCNCSILGDPVTHEAIVVDPGDDVERILEILRRHQLKVLAIVSTHTHIDHVGGLAQLHRVTGAPVLFHEADLPLYRSLDEQAQWLGVPTPEMMRVEDFVKEGDTLRWGGFGAHVLHTPGHTPGSISLVVQPTAAQTQSVAESTRTRDAAAKTSDAAVLLAGDTLFHGSIGRTDLPGGSYPQILNSIREKLLVLPDEMVVLPGHGEATTVGEEREYNPFLR